ncbi:MAG: thioredoxin domain-containing protein [Solirubrobacterales bacterium]
MPNRLADETSPYLLQHKDNPVDWLPWGPEAKRLAAERNVPILLSIGYSACHWCHVMERESFEDEATASFMNEGFLPVKVDREERPDIDAIYMEAVQSMTGQGGWPMTVFCDPDGVPFYGGTYFPPQPRQGMPSFQMVMEAVLDAWSNRRDEIDERAEKTRDQLAAIARIAPADEPLEPGLLERATEGLKRMADLQNGGFGGAPKFPPASAIDLLLALGERAIPERTLDAMAAGGIYDQLGGGFARYSVDGVWLVPHFEKMLYDNALLARSYLRGYLEFGHQRYRRVCVETLDWALEEMRGPEGAFYSALDADSEGVEGRYYTWSADEVREVLTEAGLDPEAVGVLEHLGVTDAGNWEGTNVLNLRGGAASERPQGWEAARQALLARRAERVRPGLDDKRLTSWNALMISALAEAGAALTEPRYLNAAGECADFLLTEMRDSEGRLLRSFNRGRGHLNAYLEDHAYLVEALVALYEASFEPRWFAAARELAEAMIERFGDSENGACFTTSDDHEQLIARRTDVDDHPIPSGNASAALGLLRLEALSGARHYGEWAEGVLRMLSGPAERHPEALAYLLTAASFQLSPTREVALIAPDGADRGALSDLAAVVRARFRPDVVLAGGNAGASEPALLADRPASDGGATAYVCERFACKAPVSSPEDLAALLD